jgi:hypothetical protein
MVQLAAALSEGSFLNRLRTLFEVEERIGQVVGLALVFPFWLRNS